VSCCGGEKEKGHDEETGQEKGARRCLGFGEKRDQEMKKIDMTCGPEMSLRYKR
jgi:hypothetical protein